MDGYIVGIDIGSSKICAAVGKLDRQNNLQLAGITSVNCKGLKKAVVVDIDSTSETIRSCIQQLERMVDIEITEAYISLPAGTGELIKNNAVVAVSSEDREISDNDIDRVLNAAKIITLSPDKEIIGVVPQQFIVDDYDGIRDPIGMTGSRLEVEAQIIVAHTIVVGNLLKSVGKAGLKVKGFCLQTLATSEVILKREEKELCTALVDVGAEIIDIAVYKSGNLCYNDMIPLGGSNITNDISVCLKIPFSESEKLKVKYGSVGEGINIIEDKIQVTDIYNNVLIVETAELKAIIEARVEELLFFINEKLKKSGYYEQVSGIVLVGGGISLLKGIESFSKNFTGKSVRVGAPQFVGASSPIYATAVGIVQDVVGSLRTYEDSKELTENTFIKKKPKKEKKTGNSVMLKIKDFLADFF